MWRYPLAVGAALLAFGLRELMQPFLEAHMPALFFMIAAVLVGFYLGIRPAILVVVIGIPLADYYFVPPFKNFGHIDKADFILFVAFPTVTLSLLVMIEWLRRTQHEARLFTEVARCRYDMLLRAEKRRKQARNPASQSLSLMARHSMKNTAEAASACTVANVMTEEAL